MRSWMRGATVCALVPMMGCGAVLDAAVKQAGQQVGRSIGDRVGKQVGTVAAGYTANLMMNLSPALMQAYSLALFSLLFYQGGYWFVGMQTTPYRAGDYTRWTAPGAAQGDWFEKALLRVEKDGKQWWRVHAKGRDKQGKEQEVILEALFSKADRSGAHRILRMRALLPDGKQPEEIPITEQNQASWVLRPRVRLSKESLAGATVGTETVTVPAGRFKARHIRYAGASGTNEWWLVRKGVPGGFVQYAIEQKGHGRQEGEDKTESVVVQLESHGRGDGASKLGAF